MEEESKKFAAIYEKSLKELEAKYEQEVDKAMLNITSKINTSLESKKE